MTFYPELLLTPWHGIAFIMSAIAFISLVIGGYSSETVIKKGISATLLFYILTTVFVMVSYQEIKYIDQVMKEELVEVYERNQNHLDSNRVEEHIAIAVTNFEKEQGFNIVIYAQNFHNTRTYAGNIEFTALDDDGDILFERVFHNIELSPNERTELHRFHSSISSDVYQYYIQPSSE